MVLRRIGLVSHNEAAGHGEAVVVVSVRGSISMIVSMHYKI